MPVLERLCEPSQAEQNGSYVRADTPGPLVSRLELEGFVPERNQPSEYAGEVLDDVVEGTADHCFCLNPIAWVGPTIAADEAATVVGVAQDEPSHSYEIPQRSGRRVGEPNVIALALPSHVSEPFEISPERDVVEFRKRVR